MLSEYFSAYHGGIYRENDILKYIFLPYCLGLKVKSKKMLNEFLQGIGYSEFEKYVKSNDRVLSIAMHDIKSNQKIKYNIVKIIIIWPYWA